MIRDWGNRPGRADSYETPLSAANPRAFARVSAKLTEPAFDGLILLKSTCPAELGCGKPYGDADCGPDAG